MFIKATYNNEECLLNTDYIVDIFNADKWVADVYVLDVDRDAYKVKQSEIQRLIDDTADTPQTKRIKTPDYCDICNHKGCDNCIANSLDDYCVPSGYAPKDAPQTESQIITCYGTYTNKCGTYEKDDCILNAKQVDTPQTDLLVKTPQKSRESHEKDTPQTERKNDD